MSFLLGDSALLVPANAGEHGVVGQFDGKTPHVGQAAPAAEWLDRDGFQLHDTQHRIPAGTACPTYLKTDPRANRARKTNAPRSSPEVCWLHLSNCPCASARQCPNSARAVLSYATISTTPLATDARPTCQWRFRKTTNAVLCRYAAGLLLDLTGCHTIGAHPTTHHRFSLLWKFHNSHLYQLR